MWNWFTARLRWLLLLLPCTVPVFAQNRCEVSLGGEYMFTSFNLHSPYSTFGTGLEAMWFPYITDSYSYGLKLDLGLTPQGICGNRIGAAFLVRTPVLRWLDIDMGLGLASYSQPEFVTHDTNNLFISTPLVCLIDFGVVAHLESGPSVGLRLLHSSNGNMRRPNRGVNYFRLEMGFPLAVDRRPLPAPSAPFSPFHEMGVMVASGLTFSRHSMQKGLFYCYDVALNYEYRHSPNHGYGATVDLWYNFSHMWQLPRYHDTYPLPVYFSTQLFVERFWGPLSVKGGIGWVIAASSRVDIPVYERLALYYNFGNNYVGVGINAHAGQAEFIEWSFGRRFPIRSKGSP